MSARRLGLSAAGQQLIGSGRRGGTSSSSPRLRAFAFAARLIIDAAVKAEIPAVLPGGAELFTSMTRVDLLRVSLRCGEGSSVDFSGTAPAQPHVVECEAHWEKFLRLASP